MTHLLVTNDYPPKIGGIQSYLYELWRRIPPDRFVVLTTAYPDADRFDQEAPHRIVRMDRRMFLPTPLLAEHIRNLAEEVDASLIVLDPAFPLGMISGSLGVPYAVILHGAEVTVPGRLWGVRRAMRKVITGAAAVIAAGEYPERQARRIAGTEMPRTIVIPPGVDADRFHPITENDRRLARARLGVPMDARLVLSVSRLVPRKGMDVLIEAASRLAPMRPDMRVIIAGTGRDEKRLRALIKERVAPVELVGAVSEPDLPSLYGAADIFAMLARDRWLGLEQEGFGIVFLEAAASGVAQVAGRSGGTIDAVVHGKTGLVVDRPGDVVVASDALGRLLDDEALRSRLGHAARERALGSFQYDQLAGALASSLEELGG